MELCFHFASFAHMMFQSSSVGDDGWNSPLPVMFSSYCCFNPHPSEMTDGTRYCLCLRIMAFRFQSSSVGDDGWNRELQDLIEHKNMFQSSSVGDDGWNWRSSMICELMILFQSSSVGDDGWNSQLIFRRTPGQCFNPHPSEMTDGTLPDWQQCRAFCVSILIRRR